MDKECCDDCINRSRAGLQSYRQFLNDRQLELTAAADGVLFLITDFMLDAIRKFLTYSERLERDVSRQAGGETTTDRPPDIRDDYFKALANLRVHLQQCLLQVGNIAGQQPNWVQESLQFKPDWEAEN